MSSQLSITCPIYIPPIQIPPFIPHSIRIYTPPPIPIPPIKIPSSIPLHSNTIFEFPSPPFLSPTPPSTSTSNSSISTQSWSSALSSIFLRCLRCEIPLSCVAKGSDPDMCLSCENIEYDIRWKGRKIPKCMICSGNAWRIHRKCHRPICRTCVNNFKFCPLCSYPIE